MPTIKNIIIFTVIGLVFFLIYFFYIKKSPEDAALLVSSESPAVSAMSSGNSVVDAAVTQDFLTLLLSVREIKLDDSIFTNPAFDKLDGSNSITLVQDGTEGRPNPFAPIGFLAVTPAEAPASASANSQSGASDPSETPAGTVPPSPPVQ